MELRDIEIFLTVAEELHFGRAAQRLYVSPARVSQAVKLQERAIGGLLFERTSRSVRLTELGRQLRDDMAPAYQGVNEAIRRARMLARGVTGRLRVLMMPLNVMDLHVYWKEFRRRHPQCELSVRTSGFDDPFARLRNGECDVFVAWLPAEEEDLTVGPTLFTDPRMLAVVEDHVLAARSSASFETLADFPHIAPSLQLDYWEDSIIPFNTPRGRKLERVHSASNDQDLLSLLTMGQIIQIWPTHVAKFYVLPNIRWLTLPDLSVLRFALVWRTEMENDHIRARPPPSATSARWRSESLLPSSPGWSARYHQRRTPRGHADRHLRP